MFLLACLAVPQLAPQMRKQHIKTALEQEARRRTGTAVHPVRFALPFPVRCLRCSMHMDRFTRHNAQKETLSGMSSGSEVYRFSIKCAGCRGLCTLVTDPENGCYRAESSCFRVSGRVGEAHLEDDNPAGGPDIGAHRRHAELQTLKRHCRRLASADIDFVIRAVSLGKTVQGLRREEVLEALKKARPARKDDTPPR